MTRHEELNSIDYYRVSQISEKLCIHKDTVTYRIKMLELVSFESWYYSIEQIELIKDYRL